jgi:Zn-finger protein
MVEKEGRILKSCIDCTFPHEADNYEKIIKVLRKNVLQ